MTRIIAPLIVYAFLFANVAARAAPEDNGPYPFTHTTENIPARDGEMITAEVYTTRAPGRRPLIIFRHGFFRTGKSLAGYGNHWSSRGYNVILNDARTGIMPDYDGKDSTDMIGCVEWAVQKSNVPGHYLYNAVNKDAVVIGGFSAGGYAALFAAHKNSAQGQGNFTCAVTVFYDPYPTDAQQAASLASEITIPAIMLHADGDICNGWGKGDVIFKNSAGPTYAVHVNEATHCDFEPQPSLGCKLACSGGWDSDRNAAVKRYATAMIELYAEGNLEAQPYINGEIAQADTRITVYPESRGLDIPARTTPLPPQQQVITEPSIMNLKPELKGSGQ